MLSNPKRHVSYDNSNTFETKPFPNSDACRCCEDKIHCCPQGTTCDTKAGKCNKVNFQLLLPSPAAWKSYWIHHFFWDRHIPYSRHPSWKMWTPMAVMSTARMSSSARTGSPVVDWLGVHSVAVLSKMQVLWLTFLSLIGINSLILLWCRIIWVQAVCCSDNLHCCPSGFTCTTEGLCVKSAT